MGWRFSCSWWTRCAYAPSSSLDDGRLRCDEQPDGLRAWSRRRHRQLPSAQRVAERQRQRRRKRRHERRRHGWRCSSRWSWRWWWRWRPWRTWRKRRQRRQLCSDSGCGLRWFFCGCELGGRWWWWRSRRHSDQRRQLGRWWLGWRWRFGVLRDLLRHGVTSDGPWKGVFSLP